jgi:hypothetical protein
MKIKDLIKHLQTLDQEKELVVIATDPTDWDYEIVVSSENINLETIWSSVEDKMRYKLGEPDDKRIDCYVIRMDV